MEKNKLADRSLEIGKKVTARYEAMKEKGLVKENRSYPKNVEEFIYCI